ncbi:MAG: Filamentous hemagglutinin family outer membrane protein [Parcubacteria group bacterium GW2011_GWC1_39_29]|uniref:Uncharacterized protein n=1 Tax=Candidatus Yanofskybacteria bacterium GW2011_GWD1_39_16 TaxID=1619030 RepID=A0A837HZY5_9BACT|nr:MAG: hypothetical protein UT35_C0010G0007 [Candidatus Yanofskybacteria bacterium GW2011_GWD1_39_16]KKR14853.1 MAG: Filamentous hemagglutinin family outer membrane protein [Parcubacteria group bacterium GW2011_GWC1_39_29]
MSRYFPSRYSLVLIIFLFFVVTIIISLNFRKASAETSITENFAVVSGVDSNDGSNVDLSANDINKLKSTDLSRFKRTGWSMAGVFDEANYLEFVFSPNIVASATISSITLVHNFRKSNSNALNGAKFEIWDGLDFTHTEIVTIPPSSTDATNSYDISSYINTPQKINDLKVRFLAYRNPPDVIESATSHDYLGLKVTYTLPESTTPTPIPDNSPTPTPGLTPTPTPDFSPTPSLTPTPTPDPDDVDNISLTNVTITKSSAVADNSYDHGWKWILDLTIPKMEDELFVKFGDWTSNTDTISAVSNMRMYSVQSLINTSDNAVVIASASVYADGLKLTEDMDATKPGRQIQLNVEVKIPAGTIGGGYSTTYDFESR